MSPIGGPLASVFAAAFGLLLGSFLNVCIHRLPRGESVVTRRSRCPKCGAPIVAWQNVPVVSWLVLRGRCAGCGAPISIRYPVVELLSGGLVLARDAGFPWLRRLGAGERKIFFAKSFAYPLAAAPFVGLSSAPSRAPPGSISRALRPEMSTRRPFTLAALSRPPI